MSKKKKFKPSSGLSKQKDSLESMSSNLESDLNIKTNLNQSFKSIQAFSDEEDILIKEDLLRKDFSTIESIFVERMKADFSLKITNIIFHDINLVSEMIDQLHNDPKIIIGLGKQLKKDIGACNLPLSLKSINISQNQNPINTIRNIAFILTNTDKY